MIGVTLSRSAGATKPAPDEWGTIAAWSWGVSRIVDYLETDASVNAKQIALFGHSRLGKTALWASALDPRIAVVYSSCAGEMGSALARRDWGETVDDMAQNFGWQFAGNFQKWVGRWNEMPVDAHMLIALSAPRPVFITGGTTDQWADPAGEFLSEVAAGPVYRLLGRKDLGVTTLPPLDSPVTSGDLGFHYHTGGHAATPADWICVSPIPREVFSATRAGLTTQRRHELRVTSYARALRGGAAAVNSDHGRRSCAAALAASRVPKPLPPRESLRPPVRPSLDDIRDQSADDGRELESVAAVAGGDDEARPLGVVVDPEVAVERVAIEAQAAVDDRRVRERRKVAAKERAHSRLLRRQHVPGGVRFDAPSRAVMADLHRAGGQRREAVPAGAGDVGGPDREASAPASDRPDPTSNMNDRLRRWSTSRRRDVAGAPASTRPWPGSSRPRDGRRRLPSVPRAPARRSR